MPAAYLPMSLAVAGATTTRSAVWPRRVCGIGSGPPNSDVRAGSEASAENVSAPTNRCASVGEHGHDVHAGVDEPPADLDRLVRRDAAGDAEDDSTGHSDAGHRYGRQFGPGSGRGVARESSAAISTTTSSAGSLVGAGSMRS